MDAQFKAQNLALNQFCKRMNDQYHAYAVHCGLSDPALWVLYSLWETEVPMTQNDIASIWLYPKQTVNFTISGFVKKGCVQLEQRPGIRSGKTIKLTAEGVALCKQIIVPLIEAEERSLSRLTDAERHTLISLSEKQCLSFEREIHALLALPENK